MPDIRIKKTETCGDHSKETYFQADGIDYINESVVKILFPEVAKGEEEPVAGIVKMPATEPEPKVGEEIPFALEQGITGTALVLDIQGDVATCIYLDCMAEEQQMNEKDTNEGGYEESSLREKLNGPLLEAVPESSREKMVPFENGDYLMPPSEKEILGKNVYGEPEPDSVKQFEPMKKRRYRIAFRGAEEEWEWYWLRNKKVASSTSFCTCGANGNAYYGSASYSTGVRPLFRIKIR